MYCMSDYVGILEKKGLVRQRKMLIQSVADDMGAEVSSRRF